MVSNKNILGIDIGSVSISIVEIKADKQIVNSAYLFHNGNIAENLETLLAGFDLSKIGPIVSTSSTPAYINTTGQYDNQIAIMAAARHFYEKIGSILLVGGEKFSLIFFDKNNNYSKVRTNTSCAAGTGSFLDQQAGRLNCSCTKELCEIATKNKGEIPKIASRCAVFAKTDLIHAQQEGHSLEEISDGLCYGLAKNIIDTLFSGEDPNSPIIFCGGVSKNRAVTKHIRALINKDIIIDDRSHLYGAIGSAFLFLDETLNKNISLKTGSGPNNPANIISQKRTSKKLYYQPLTLTHSGYPDFNSTEKYRYQARSTRAQDWVEVDIYQELISRKSYEIYLGIDIGSTSTKAIMLQKDKSVLAGLYTRTAGQPLDAVCALFEAVDDIIRKKNIFVSVLGAGTTGSGRKFAGKIINADIVLDEITAHARAAVELNPEVDTIIEIGGQDSKFTTLKRGMVTFSVMNNVCAAGTGSFIEEQAQKLGCPISDYSARAENLKAPMTSDRCTVFMERDINHYLSEGYSVDEVLASVLHSVRDNYLQKVATKSHIGSVIFFQGATAKNKALVAAFEQKLKKPILVSKYCHLTGALGVSLGLWEQKSAGTRFRGFNLYKHKMPIKSETCELCSNNCKLTLATIENEKVAYGFLCGRDYDTKRYVNNNKSGFDLLKAHKQAFPDPPDDQAIAKNTRNKPITIGLPAALYLFEDLPLWKKFFSLLAVNTVTSEPCKTAVKQGKNLTGAEFCAPITALHGHVNYLMDKTDYIFLPYYIENKEKEGRRQYCYYSQFVPALISAPGDNNKFLMPVVKYLYTSFHTKMQLYRSLNSITGHNFFEISSAFDSALEYKALGQQKLRDRYLREVQKTEDISVVFLGRPYTILSSTANNQIPAIFASLGIKGFYQDMLGCSKADTSQINPLLKEVPWRYAADILGAAQIIANAKGIYPVLITSFKCAPDSFIIDFFKNIMENHEKPYLILELDEHDSSVGYETRIEAAIRSFRNNNREQTRPVSPKKARVNPSIEKSLLGKTVILPNWDNLTNSLLVANLNREGIKTLLMEETEGTIQKSLKYNTGQCIPLNAITQGFVDCIKKNNLDPAETILWMMEAETCSLKIYPHYIKNLLAHYGRGMEKAGIYSGQISFIDISLRASINSYFAFMFSGLIRKMACRLRPYEINKGDTDRAITKSQNILIDAFLGNRSKEEAVAETVSYFEKIPIKKEDRPKVAIFGDIYVRDNEVMNQDLIRYIEDHGGEVITTPYTHYCKMIASSYFKKWFIEGRYFSLFTYMTLMTMMNRWEKIYYKYFEKILKEPDTEFNESSEDILSEYNIIAENTGESMDNILKIFYIKKHYPEVSLFVQTCPAFCCPSLITEAMANAIEKNTGTPIVSITYDGIGGEKNREIIPYLSYPRRPLSPDLDKSASG